VEAGRIKDGPGARLKTALREVLERYRVEMRLTASQNLLLVNVAEGDREEINRILAAQQVLVERQAAKVRLASMACPALPTCGLALAESERVLPEVLAGFEGLLSRLNLAEEEIIIRMTGCPNGCVRPYMAEVGIVGRAPQKYHVFLGGNEGSTRMNRLFRENVKQAELLPVLEPVLARYAQERQPGERFGDWCERVLWKETEAAGN
jgi:sulfite reductase (NADPH) hemoprotein beta-component